MPKALCRQCGREFDSSAARTAYCQQACYIAFVRLRAAESLVDRFWAKVKKSDGCWLWTGSLIKGYGQFHLPRTHAVQQTVYAHRFAWEQTNGPIADNLSVLHRCDTPRCCRPDHLFLGTQQDNLADARTKGRLIDGRHLIKVDDAGLLDIVTNYRPRQNGQQLAAKYGVSLVSIMRIVAGTQRVQRPIFERVPSAQIPVRGEVA